MKKQNILIAYINYRNVQSISKRERTFKKVMEPMTARGLKLVEMNKDSRGLKAKFDDGSMITMVSFGVSLHGHRFTHLYLDEEAFELAGGEQYISQVLMPQIVSDGIELYQDYDTKGAVGERIKLFSVDNDYKVNFRNFTTR